MKKLTNFILIFLFALIVIFPYCKKDSTSEPEVFDDAKLLSLAKETGNFTWYKNSDIFLEKSSGSGHSQPYLRVRYNSVAASKLDASKKVVAGSIFPDGSLIVKELWASKTELSLYAIMYKKTGNQNASSDGWLWGYIKPDGSIVAPVANKGAMCTACHGGTGNIDRTLMNVAIP